MFEEIKQPINQNEPSSGDGEGNGNEPIILPEPNAPETITKGG